MNRIIDWFRAVWEFFAAGYNVLRGTPVTTMSIPTQPGVTLTLAYDRWQARKPSFRAGYLSQIAYRAEMAVRSEPEDRLRNCILAYATQGDADDDPIAWVALEVGAVGELDRDAIVARLQWFQRVAQAQDREDEGY